MREYPEGGEGALAVGHPQTPSVASGATSPQCHYGVAWRGWLSTSLPILMGVWLTLVLPLRWA